MMVSFHSFQPYLGFISLKQPPVYSTKLDWAADENEGLPQ